MLTITLALASFLPAVTPQQDPPPVRVAPLGGVEAPAQPRSRSTSTYGETPRIERRAPRGLGRAILAPLDSLVDVRGQEQNHVFGIGLVTGLNGTGDSPQMTRQLVRNMLLAENINVNEQDLTAKNAAVVRVEAMIPPGVKPGRRINVTVTAFGDAESLAGGSLVMTPLKDIDAHMVYATAAGPLTVGGFSVGGEGATATKNHPTVGVLPSGGKVEREVPSSIVSEHGYIYLDMRAMHNAFGNMVRITDAVNGIYPNAAVATPDGRTVRVSVPPDLPEHLHVAFLDSILALEVIPDDVSRVIVNERTGVIVMGGDVRLRPGAVHQGALTITIAESPETSQPGAFSGGETQSQDRTDLDVVEENNGVTLLPGAVNLEEVVEVLNVLGTTPRDTISILEAMSQAGMLLADIERM